jgi:hypothetical protein
MPYGVLSERLTEEKTKGGHPVDESFFQNSKPETLVFDCMRHNIYRSLLLNNGLSQTISQEHVEFGTDFTVQLVFRSTIQAQPPAKSSEPPIQWTEKNTSFRYDMLHFQLLMNRGPLPPPFSTP